MNLKLKQRKQSWHKKNVNPVHPACSLLFGGSSLLTPWCLPGGLGFRACRGIARRREYLATRLFRVHRTMATSFESLSVEGFSLFSPPYKAVKPHKPTPCLEFGQAPLWTGLKPPRAPEGSQAPSRGPILGPPPPQATEGLEPAPRKNLWRYRVRRLCYSLHGFGEAGWPFAIGCEGLKRRPPTVGGRPMP